MELPNPEILRQILGLKLRRYRQEKGFGLKDLAAKAGLSVSYLSEIEKGKKYPKPEKLLLLAGALEVPFDGLVTLEVDGELGPLRELFASAFIREFPFHLYGIELGDLFALLTEEPSKAGAMVHTALEIGRLYNLQVEHFLFAALRSYQYLRRNYFADIEEAAAKFRHELGLAEGEVPAEEALVQMLERRHGYVLEDGRLEDTPELADLRSVVQEGPPPRLLLNGRLLPAQRAFMLARELGYRCLGHQDRSVASPSVQVLSFDQVIHDFEAAYFSGAVLLDRKALERDLEEFFGRQTWSEEAFLDLLERYRTTPETFFYRLSQLLPSRFGLRDLFFLRFNHNLDGGDLRLTKILNLSPLAIPYGLEQQEHYCRRWLGIETLTAETGHPDEVRAGVQRARFVVDDSEYFVLTLSRPLALKPSVLSSVSLAIRLDARLRKRLRFFQDAEAPSRDVHLTCERCPLSNCRERAADKVLLDEQERRQRRQEALEELLGAGKGLSG